LPLPARLDGMADERTFVIIGAGLAAAKAAETLREEGFDGRLVILGEETERPYERPPLSKGYLLGNEPRDVAFVHDAGWYAENDVDLRLGRRATALDPVAHDITIDGYEHLRYDKLLLATGARVRRLDVPGADLEGVRYLRTMDEAEALLAHLGDGGRVVVVGAGWIGLEAAAAARKHAAEVTLLVRDTLPLRRLLGDEVATVLADLHRANGVTVRPESSVAAFRGEDGHLTTVVLADLAIIGIGVEPAVELAEAAGLAVNDGVVTDAGLRTTDPDIYACGDVAASDHPLVGRRIRVEHWANALNGGPAAARAMLGDTTPYDRLPYAFSDQYDLGLEYAGWVAPGGYDRVVFRGDPIVVGRKAPEFVAFWVLGGRVLAGMNANVWDVQDAIQTLVRAGMAGTAVDLARLGDPQTPLADLLS
jgi:3-phenylpropionate/trans-cinnamate dioxygenase ferredoxin reductase subunit